MTPAALWIGEGRVRATRLAALRTKRQELGEVAYYQQVEALLVRLARVYAQVDKRP